MKKKIDSVNTDQQEKSNHSKSKLKTALVIFELCLVLFLLLLWFSSSSIRESKNLWILFLYNFPSQFFIAVVPHEPVFFYFSKFYSVWTVTSIAVAGTLITELINYSMLQYFSDFRLFKKLTANKVVKKLVHLFKKAPFLALLVAGITPVPFYPFRFLVVISNYPLPKYAFAVFLARTFRFYVFAQIGHSLQIPDHFLLLFFLLLIIIGLLPALKNFPQNIKKVFKMNDDTIISTEKVWLKKK